MGRVNDDKWLDKALDKAIHSDDTRPDFNTWVANHPEAVKSLTSRTPQSRQPLRIRRIIMNATFVKLAAAAVIAVAAIVGIARFTQNPADKPLPSCGLVAVGQTVTGPTTHTFADGSSVKLAEGASIRTFASADKRGFEHLAGRIDVTVAKGHGEFIVTSPYGDVKALGTQFTMDLLDGVADNTKQPVKMLNVEVTEGVVEVRNAKGVQTLKPTQSAMIAADTAPYDFNQDPALPEGLRQRIAAMAKAFETGDKAAWAANYNMNYVYKLGKGQTQYDPNLFGGTAEDAERIKQAVAGVGSVEEMRQLFLGSINITQPVEVYVRSVELSKDGKHAKAECIQRKNGNHMVTTWPQWHDFEGGWWQIDD
jgi:ferric-dicitrate binding protein FerR (iron transport regulator)